MENEVVMRKEMKVEIPEITPPQSRMLERKGSLTKSSCLCSPTTHVGSFRCRLHRSPTLRRTRSIGYEEAKTKEETTMFLQNNAGGYAQ